MERLDRRRFLKLGSGALLLAGCDGSGLVAPGPRDDDAADARDTTAEGGPWGEPLDAALFPFGVQAGDATTDAALVQVHYLGRERLTLHVAPVGAASDDDTRRVPAHPGATGATRVALGGLAADTAYRYVFTTADHRRSAIGRFTTALAPGASRVVRFGGSSCTNASVRPWSPLEAAAAQALDFYLLAGDTTYCDGARTLDDYRAKWAHTRGTPEYQALFGSCGVYATWDDHEVDNDWNPETTDPAQVEAATIAFAEHVPLHLRAPDGSRRLWRSQRWGDVLELFVLDCRSERRPSTAGTPDATYLSAAQEAWLLAGLSASPCRWKVILNSVPITHMPDYFQQVRDRWDRYPAQRTRVLDHIAGMGAAGRVLWVTGDYHFAALMHVDRPGGPYDGRWEVLTSPAGNAANSEWPRVLVEDPVQFAWATGTRNTAIFEADPVADVIRVAWLDGDGRVLHSAELDV